jgi:hypothetical protein
MISTNDTRAERLALASEEFANETARALAWLSGRERIPADWIEAFAETTRWMPEEWILLTKEHREELIRVGIEFLDQWSLEASELGWRPSFVFDSFGLIYSMAARAIIEVTEDSVTLHSPPPFATRTLRLNRANDRWWWSLGYFHDQVRR